MTTIVIMPGGFHPFHAGHAALYQSAQRTFPDADVYVAATNDTSSRPFPFAVKEKLARLAGVETGHFVQVKSPFKAEEIIAKFDPEKDVLIFVRSEKDAAQPPQPGGVKKDGSPSYLQPLLGARKLEPFAKHAYMAYLPTVEFGPGMTSATEIRSAWPRLNEKRKTALVMSLYPKTQTSPQLAQTVVKLLDTALDVVDESALDNLPRPNKRNQFKSLHKQRKERGLDEQGVAEGSLEEIDRRGFLKGVGAAAVAGAAGSAMAQSRPVDVSREFQNMRQDDPRVQHNKDIEEMARAIYEQIVATRGQPIDRRQQQMWMTIAREKATEKLSKYAPGRPAPQSQSSGFPSQGSERRVSRNIDNFESQGVAEGLFDRFKKKLTANIGGIDLTAFKEGGRIIIDASSQGKQLGIVMFNINGKTLVADRLMVQPEYRGQGIAEIMYDWAKGLGYTVQRSSDQTDDGKRFWDKLKGEETNVWEQGVGENQGWAATFTNEDDYIEEKWSSKYKNSINCAAPRGFSQRAHCAGRKK
jgi:GNAT superfamily N-acetyltransferase